MESYENFDTKYGYTKVKFGPGPDWVAGPASLKWNWPFTKTTGLGPGGQCICRTLPTCISVAALRSTAYNDLLL